MLILGEQHRFTELELEALNKKFKSIDVIKYKDIDTQTVIKQISSIISQKQKVLIILNTKALVPYELLKYLTKLEQEGIKYISVQTFMEKYLYKSYIPSELTDISFLEKIQPFSTFEHGIKLTIDYIFSISLLLLSTPFMLYSIYRIKKESPGPVLFKQKRVGLNGKEFTCIKFRSMRMDAEKHGAQFATKDDERIFSWGKTMRETRIDELPQLWNILKGDMHLIGPRPERQIWIDQFEKEIPYYNERHLVKPGVTGWAQVLYPYGSSADDAKQKLMYDLYYIKNWSFWLEVKSIWRTIVVVLGRKGV